MKRLSALASLLCLAALGCAPGDEAALTVNGDEVLTVGDLQDQLDDIADDDDFLTTFEGRGAGPGTLSAGFVSSVLSNHVLTHLLAVTLEADGVEVTDEDVAAGEEQLAAATGGSIENIPPSYRETLRELFGSATALRGALGGDDEALQVRISELLLDAEVEVADRYGSWDTETASVIAPEGPVAPPTTLPLAPVPAG